MKVIKNFNIVTAEHRAKCQVRLSTGCREAAQEARQARGLSSFIHSSSFKNATWAPSVTGVTASISTHVKCGICEMPTAKTKQRQEKVHRRAMGARWSVSVPLVPSWADAAF